MTFLTKYLVVPTLLIGLASASAFAVEPGGAKITGKLTQTLTANNVVNVGAGLRSTARLSVAAVQNGSEVGGDVRQTVAAKNIVNVAAGLRSKACASLATVGTPSC